MKWIFILAGIVVFNTGLAQNGMPAARSKYVLVIHGGAGTISPKNMTPEKEKAYKDALTLALQKGYAVLKSGGSSMDAVTQAVMVMENSPLFNAGKGAVFTSEGRNELDAAVMNGANLAAGAVAGVTTIKNPVLAARAVMEKSNHVMMAGGGAEKFAASVGVEIVDPSYFYTPERWESLQRVKREDSLKALQIKGSEKKDRQSYLFTNKDSKFGTVGAVALDQQGNLAAATSTGGMTNKKYGRIGDSPIIGAGTYANNSTCAVSGTGWGEYFIRLVMAKSISDMMEFGKYSLKDAADEMVMKRLPALGGDGGLIALDKDGNYTMPFNTTGMYRGVVREDGKVEVEIFK